VFSEAFQEALMLWCLGLVAERRDELATAARRYDEALGIVRPRSEPDTYSEHILAIILTYRSYVAVLNGDFERALQANEEAHRIWTRRNDLDSIGLAIESRGSIEVARRHFDTAARIYRTCMDHYRAMGSRHGMVSILTGLGIVAAGFGHDREAASFFGTSERVRDELSIPVPHGLRLEYDRALRSIRATLGERRFDAAWQDGLNRPFEDAVAEACAMQGIPRGDCILSKREREVLALLARGESNQAIADQLYLSPRTVESHVSSILTKLDVPSRRKAVSEAQERGLLGADFD
jgi:ATP/maltotriose-dependent transcriptional regulator MalT